MKKLISKIATKLSRKEQIVESFKAEMKPTFNLDSVEIEENVPSNEDIIAEILEKKKEADAVENPDGVPSIKHRYRLVQHTPEVAKFRALDIEPDFLAFRYICIYKNGESKVYLGGTNEEPLEKTEADLEFINNAEID